MPCAHFYSYQSGLSFDKLLPNSEGIGFRAKRNQTIILIEVEQRPTVLSLDLLRSLASASGYGQRDSASLYLFRVMGELTFLAILPAYAVLIS